MRARGGYKKGDVVIRVRCERQELLMFYSFVCLWKNGFRGFSFIISFIIVVCANESGIFL